MNKIVIRMLLWCMYNVVNKKTGNRKFMYKYLT